MSHSGTPMSDNFANSSLPHPSDPETMFAGQARLTSMQTVHCINQNTSALTLASSTDVDTSTSVSQLCCCLSILVLRSTGQFKAAYPGRGTQGHKNSNTRSVDMNTSPCCGRHHHNNIEKFHGGCSFYAF